jgi:TolB-like protein
MAAGIYLRSELARSGRGRYRLSGSAVSTVQQVAPAPIAPRRWPSLDVLPFQNMNGDPEQDYFADGVVEDITTDAR